MVKQNKVRSSLTAVLCVLLVFSGVPTKVIASASCKDTTYINPSSGSCSCSDSSCPTSEYTINGYYKCTPAIAGYTECDNGYSDVGNNFPCTLSSNWSAIGACALMGGGCVIACATAVTGVAAVGCVLCIAGYGAACRGCNIIDCDKATVGTPILVETYVDGSASGTCPGLG